MNLLYCPDGMMFSPSDKARYADRSVRCAGSHVVVEQTCSAFCWQSNCTSGGLLANATAHGCRDFWRYLGARQRPWWSLFARYSPSQLGVVVKGFNSGTIRSSPREWLQ
eukprot:6695303-Lingulodinium_polyedra.AAC.1